MHSFKGASTRGFSIVEMLVVFLVITVLVAIVITVAQRVSHGGKARTTQDLLRSLDQVLSSYLNDTEAAFPSTLSFLSDPNNPNSPRRTVPIADARPAVANNFTAPALPSLSLFLLEVGQRGGVEGRLASVDPRFVRQLPIANDVMVDLRGAYGFSSLQNVPTGALAQSRAYEILDAFEEPIRFVHPAWHGGYGSFWGDGALQNRDTRQFDSQNLRRSYRPFDPNTVAGVTGDADEGLCVNNRPYFYSGGIDRDAGTRSDNVYTGEGPTFPRATEAYGD